MVNVQDFGTDELIAALKERGFDVLTKDKEASIRAEEREACAQIVESRVRYSHHRRTAMRAVGDEALRMAKEIRARSKGGA